jgi:hypothetical protein
MAPPRLGTSPALLRRVAPLDGATEKERRHMGTDRRNRRRTLVAVAALVAIAGATLVDRRAEAFVTNDSGTSTAIFQNGVLAGEIYRVDPPDPDVDPPDPDVDPPDPDRTEHWVLFPAYVYPRAGSGIVTRLVPNYRRYRGLEDFLARVPFEKGSRYVRVDAYDASASLPR